MEVSKLTSDNWSGCLVNHGDPALKQYRSIFKKTRPICDSGAKICCEKMEAAKEKAAQAQRIGGGVAAVFAVTGVVGVAGASIVAGLFTFGIGTPIVLGVSAAASGGAIAGGGAIATAAGVATYNVAKSYEVVMKDFKDCQREFNSMSDCAATIDEEVHAVSKVLNELLSDVDNVKRNESIRYCLKLFDILYDSIKDARVTVQACKKTMKEDTLKI